MVGTSLLGQAYTPWQTGTPLLYPLHIPWLASTYLSNFFYIYMVGSNLVGFYPFITSCLHTLVGWYLYPSRQIQHTRPVSSFRSSICFNTELSAFTWPFSFVFKNVTNTIFEIPEIKMTVNRTLFWMQHKVKNTPVSTLHLHYICTRDSLSPRPEYLMDADYPLLY